MTLSHVAALARRVARRLPVPVWAGAALLAAGGMALLAAHALRPQREPRAAPAAPRPLAKRAPVPARNLPRVVVVWPDGRRTPDRVALARLSRWLEETRVPFRALDRRFLSLASLKPFRVAVITSGALTPTHLHLLQAFVAGGGRILALGPRGPAGLYALLGVHCSGWSAAAHAGQYRRIALSREGAPPGLPAEMEQRSDAVLAMQPLPGTSVLGWWEGRQGRSLPAVVLCDAGLLVGDSLSADGPRQKRAFLLAALGALDPELWNQAARALQAANRMRLAEQRARWSRIGRRPGLGARVRKVARLVARSRQAVSSASAHGVRGYAAYARALDSAFLLDCLESAMTPSPRNEVRGFWIHTYRPTDWDAVMARAKAGGLNAAFVRVGRGGNVIYPSGLLPRDAWAEAAGGDELQRALNAARRYGLAFHAWRVVYHLGSAGEAYQRRLAEEDRLVRGPEGRQALWANPGDPRNQELEVEVARELVTRYAVDGLHLDYIRYPDAPHNRFDYGAVSRREFERATRLKVARWPADVLAGPLRSRYEEWQRANITRLVARISQVVREARPGLKVSAAVWRRYPWCRDAVRQDWPRWVRAGRLDFVVPMNYVLDPEEQAQMVRAQLRATRRSRPLLAGIGTWQLQTPGDTLAQVRAARAAGAKGFVLFSFNDEEIGRHLEVLAAGACAP